MSKSACETSRSSRRKQVYLTCQPLFISPLFIDGASGSSTCPPGQGTRAGIDLVDGSLTKNAVQLFIPGASALQSATVYLSVLENGSEEVNRRTLGTAVAGTDTKAALKTFSNLKQNTRYTAVTHIGDVTKIISRFCFKTAADLEIRFGSGRAVGPGDSWSSGCFAFSSDRNHIQACLSGARNSSGSWARTDAEDGYDTLGTPPGGPVWAARPTDGPETAAA